MRSPASASAVALTAALIACGGGEGPDAARPQAPPDASVATLTVRAEGPGRIRITTAGGDRECPPDCAIAVAPGGTATLAALPDDGASFTGWSGACSGTGECVVSVAADTEVVAAFARDPPPSPQPPPPRPVTLTVALAGDGTGTVSSDPAGIACGTTCSAAFTEGTSVTLAALAAEGSTFAGWGGACSGVGACTVTLSGSAVAVAAQFVRASANLRWRATELRHPDGQVVGRDLDERGNVVGVVIGASGARPFLHDASAGTIAILPLDLRPVALAAGVIAFVSNDGSRGYRYEGGSLREIGAGVQPVDVGPQGWIVGFVTTPEGRNHAFAEDGTELRTFDGLPPDDQSFAWAVNGHGIVVGTSDQRAVRLTTTGRAVDLEIPPVAWARDVSETGIVAGSAGRTGRWPPKGFVKDLATGAITLVDPPAGHAGVSFERVNAAGTVIAQVFGPEAGPTLWSAGRYQAIADLVPDLGWTITAAPEIDDRGRILVVGHGPDSLARTAILIPPDVP